MFRLTLSILLLLSVVAPAWAEAPRLDSAEMSLAEFEAQFPLERRIELLESDRRIEMLSLQPVIDALQLKKGMSVLDLGAGSGYFTFSLAEKLQGSGTVFATEIDRGKLAHLAARAGNGPYRNIVPVAVSADGLDPFYRSREFDRILVAEVYEYFPDPVSFLRALKGSLKKETGRLLLVALNTYVPFVPRDVSNPAGLLGRLRDEGETFPVFLRLSRPAQDFVRGWRPEMDIPGAQLRQIVADLNVILSDRIFFTEINAYYSAREATPHGILKHIPRCNLPLVKWLLINATASGAMNPESDLSALQHETIYTLNRLALLGVFSSVLEDSGEANGYLRAFYHSKRGLIDQMKTAGYRLVASHDGLAYHYLLEFARDD